MGLEHGSGIMVPRVEESSRKCLGKVVMDHGKVAVKLRLVAVDLYGKVVEANFLKYGFSRYGFLKF